MASIFISYRREDSGGHAGRLCDRLTARFGDDRVFLDIQDIRPGQNFATSIEDTIATCDCVIAVIGAHWLETIQKRADASDDFVRHEIAAALKRRVTVIPVLMGGARMPAAHDLPSGSPGEPPQRHRDPRRAFDQTSSLERRFSRACCTSRPVGGGTAQRLVRRRASSSRSCSRAPSGVSRAPGAPGEARFASAPVPERHHQ
jgi:hypothetical protein